MIQPRWDYGPEVTIRTRMVLHGCVGHIPIAAKRVWSAGRMSVTGQRYESLNQDLTLKLGDNTNDNIQSGFLRGEPFFHFH